MTNYDAGRRVEHLNRDHLEAEGYVVLRTAGSKGFVDLIALKPGEILLVQCKGNGKLSGADWDRLIDRASWIGAVPILATRTALGCPDFHRPDQARPVRCGTALYRLLGEYEPRTPFERQAWAPFVTDELGGAA